MSVKDRPQRLCSEIQLFDLCSKETCSKKKGRYCTDDALLDEFEAISNEEEFSSDTYREDEPDDMSDDEEFPGAGYSYDYEEDEDAFDEEP